MEELMYSKSYAEYKAELDSELQRSAESFVRIGYLLKVARDTNILAESGYKTVAEFAEAEYSLNKTQVSRFISINDKFSENGYSERLQAAYQGYGYAKLTIMLQIPEEIAEELSPEFTKTEIQAIKDEIDEEKKVSDIEILMEGKRKDQADMTILERTIHQLGENDHQLFREIYECMRNMIMTEGILKEIMAPAGEKIYSVRIMGMGRVLLSVKDNEDRISITPVRAPEDKVVCDWGELKNAWWMLMQTAEGLEGAEAAWEYIYQLDFPGKIKIAPVQQPAETEKKPANKKKIEITRAKEPKKPIKTESNTDSEQEEQIEGQMQIEDYPEVVPDIKYKEVAADVDSDADEEGEHSAGNIIRMPGRSGAGEYAVGSGRVEGTEVQNDNASNGTAENGGCPADNGAIRSILNGIYAQFDAMEVQIDRMRARSEMPFNDELHMLRSIALNMAAGVEKLLMEG